MNNLLTIDIRAAKRIVCIVLAALLFAAGLPLLNHSAKAAQIDQRSIKMSDSANSGTSITTGIGSGTDVTYRVSFDAIAQGESLVIDFCNEAPLANDPCTRPTGMGAATGVTAVTGPIGGAGWTLTAAAGQIKLANDGNAAHDFMPGTQSFDLTGITNPSSVGSFYARIYTYAANDFGSYTGPTVAGNFVDYGGVALSTVRVITITARVTEQLTFCVTKADPGSWNTNHDCSDPVVGSAANQPAVTLGHGSPTLILDSSQVDTGSIYSQLSTNATYGAVVRMRNSNITCGGLSADNGNTCSIPPVGATASAISPGTAAFGLFVGNSFITPLTDGIGSLTPSTTYNDGVHNDPNTPTSLYFGMDFTTANDNIAYTFGSTLCSTTTPVYRVNTQYVFAATSALTTPAGIYTANLSMIATGTF